MYTRVYYRHGETVMFLTNTRYCAGNHFLTATFVYNIQKLKMYKENRRRCIV